MDDLYYMRMRMKKNVKLKSSKTLKKRCTGSSTMPLQVSPPHSLFRHQNT